jgi:hypothetical protein
MADSLQNDFHAREDVSAGRRMAFIAEEAAAEGECLDAGEKE